MTRYDPEKHRPLDYQAPQHDERKSVWRVILTALVAIVIGIIVVLGLLLGTCYLMMRK